MTKTKLIDKKESIRFTLPNGTKSPVFKNGNEAAEWYVQNFPRTGYRITNQPVQKQVQDNPVINLPEVTVYPNAAVKKESEQDQQNKTQIINGNYFGHKFTPTDQNINHYMNLYDKDKQVHNATDASKWAKFALTNAAIGSGIYGATSAALTSLPALGKLGINLGLGYLGGTGVNTASKTITGKTFGQNLGDAITNNTAFTVTPETADIFNPGYLLAFNRIPKLKNKINIKPEPKPKPKPEIESPITLPQQSIQDKTKARYLRDLINDGSIVSKLTNTKPNYVTIFALNHKQDYPVKISSAFTPDEANQIINAYEKRGRPLQMTVPLRSKIMEVDYIAKLFTSMRGNMKDYYQSKYYRTKLRNLLKEANLSDKSIEGNYIRSLQDNLNAINSHIGSFKDKDVAGVSNIGNINLNIYSNSYAAAHEYTHAANQFGSYIPKINKFYGNRLQQIIKNHNQDIINSLPLSKNNLTPYEQYVIDPSEIQANLQPIQMMMQKIGWNAKQAVRMLKNRRFLMDSGLRAYYDLYGEEGFATLLDKIMKKGGKLIKKK